MGFTPTQAGYHILSISQKCLVDIFSLTFSTYSEMFYRIQPCLFTLELIIHPPICPSLVSTNYRMQALILMLCFIS